MIKFKEKIQFGDSCWKWLGAKNNKGYGLFRVGDRVRTAHRIMWEYVYSAIPKGRHVCHTCDDPACVNPAHLYLASNLENHKDSAKKGRAAKSLTEVKVRDILASNEVHQLLADCYGVSRPMISYIKAGKFWRWLT